MGRRSASTANASTANASAGSAALLFGFSGLGHLIALPASLAAQSFASGRANEDSETLKPLMFIPALGSSALFWASFLIAGGAFLAGAAMLTRAGERAARSWSWVVLVLAALSLVELCLYSGYFVGTGLIEVARDTGHVVERLIAWS